ncbi:hypothetical protein E2320_012290 [Naja naja]|nr:hypothetical protein E2320_012290 [Naja naja]
MKGAGPALQREPDSEGAWPWAEYVAFSQDFRGPLAPVPGGGARGNSWRGRGILPIQKGP